MNKRLFFVLLMSTATVFLVQFFTNKNKVQQGIEKIQPGQSYKIPTKEEILKPLNREINFSEKKIVAKEVLSEVDTKLCKVVFTNFGAVLDSIEYKKRPGKENVPLKTVHHKDFFHREDGCFLLALQEKTPYFYKPVSQDDFDDKVEVKYQAETSDWVINKTYSIYKDKYKFDLDIEFTSKHGKASPIQSRLFVPAPFVSEIPKDSSNGFAFNIKKNSIKIIPQRELLESAWLTPQMFGCEDRYFANSLIGDKEHFVQRAYYKNSGDKRLISIFEGVSVEKNKKYSLSFYVGPKDMEDMNLVDPRLEGLLNFGLLSWICKLLLKFLGILYGYVHNYGFAIILLTLLIKLPLLPITMKTSAMTEKYQKLQPQINRIREKYKGDSQTMHAEIMRFHKERKISPATQMVGCLPLLIDLPIIWSLYRVLGNYMDLYNAPFMLWITDLSAKDPYYILPVLMGVTMFWQQKMAPVADGKQKVIMIFTTIFVTAIFSNLAAGLVLYWLSKNLLTVGETYLRKALRIK